MRTPSATLNLSIGRSCFTACPGCYNHFGEVPGGISLDIIEQFLQGAWTSGLRKVTLCGGDPLSRVGIEDFVRHHAALGWKFKLDTVGTPFLGPVDTVFFGRDRIQWVDPARMAAHLVSIGIPIDGATNRSMGVFRRGRPSILDEQLDILRCLDAVGAQICINTVVHAKNADELSDIHDLIAPFRSVMRWQLFQYAPYGRLGFRNRAQFEISDARFTDVTARICAAAQRSDLRIEAKSNHSRRRQYLLIDSDGFAWVPASDLGRNGDGSMRQVLGSIVRDSYDVIRDRFDRATRDVTTGAKSQCI